MCQFSCSSIFGCFHCGTAKGARSCCQFRPTNWWEGGREGGREGREGGARRVLSSIFLGWASFPLSLIVSCVRSFRGPLVSLTATSRDLHTQLSETGTERERSFGFFFEACVVLTFS